MVDKYLQPEINILVDNQHLAPIRVHDSDAGADLQAKENVWMPRFRRTLVPTGVKVQIPVGYVGLLVARSSLSKKEVILSNSIGIIDSSYRGELFVALTYIGSNETGLTIVMNERIAQLLVVPIVLPKFVIVDKLDDTARGSGGFGSTGG